MNSASKLVAETVWKEIQSNHSDCIFCLGKTLRRLRGLLIKKGLSEFQAFPVVAPFFSCYSFSKSVCMLLYEDLKVGESSGHTQVMGESKRKEDYYCFPEHYCACYSFFYDVVNKGEQLCCKHQLAARLAEAIGACTDLKVSDEELAILLSKL
ncbi:hypothetical protein RJ641_019213 [Dillenia turbinata]|uniref:SWIM-type domain-containing protein n=1 Tax=Dillenia turbinata TaxID=194707 RepID=A0AAN8YXC4_9MAGN